MIRAPLRARPEPIETAVVRTQFFAHEPMYGWLIVLKEEDGTFKQKSSGNFWMEVPPSVQFTHWVPYLDFLENLLIATPPPSPQMRATEQQSEAMKRLYRKLAEEGGGNWAIDVISDVEAIIGMPQPAPAEHVMGSTEERQRCAAIADEEAKRAMSGELYIARRIRDRILDPSDVAGPIASDAAGAAEPSAGMESGVRTPALHSPADQVMGSDPSLQAVLDEVGEPTKLPQLAETFGVSTIPPHVRNFLGKVQGVCLGVAMSGDDHPNPDEALMEIYREAQAILFPETSK
jgi:hypothetical protein